MSIGIKVFSKHRGKILVVLAVAAIVVVMLTSPSEPLIENIPVEYENWNLISDLNDEFRCYNIEYVCSSNDTRIRVEISNEGDRDQIGYANFATDAKNFLAIY